MNDVVENSGAQQPPQSFTERKAAQLREERAVTADKVESQPDPALTSEPPGAELESAEVADPESGYPDEEDDALASDDSEALDNELPSDSDPDQDDEPQVDWKKRYDDTKTMLNEVTENREEMDREQSEVIASQLSLKHDLQDKLTEAKRYAEAYTNQFNQQITQLEHAFQTGMIEPDNLPMARQQYQGLINQRNQLQQHMEHLDSQANEATTLERERRAEVARVRLSRTIPGWSREKHAELGQFAMSRGYSQEEFSDSLDYRFLELLNDSMQLRQAGDRVSRVERQKKAKGPRRNARQAPRSADGKYRKAKQEFRDNPNQKGRFAEMKLRQMQKENRSR